MGLWTAFKEAAKGNFRDSANYLWMDEDAISENEANQNQLQARINKLESEGTITEDQAHGLISTIQGSAYPFIWGETGPNDIFLSGMKDSVENLPSDLASLLRKGTGGAAKFIAKAMPWWLWVILIIALLVYLSPFLKIGLKYVKRR